MVSILRGIRGATDVGAIKVGGQTEEDIVIDRSRLARYGMTVRNIAQTIQTALPGTVVNAFYEGDRQFDVALRLDIRFGMPWTTSPRCRSRCRMAGRFRWMRSPPSRSSRARRA